MKIKEYPLRRCVLVKDFENSTRTTFGELTEKQKEYEIVATSFESIRGSIIRMCVIASPETIKAWNLKPLNFSHPKM